jgi:hypothetical protein
VAAGERHPAGQGEAAADEVDDEEQALPFLQRSTSAMKNSTSVAGIAEAMPPAASTTSRRRKRGSANTAESGRPGGVACRRCRRRRAGKGGQRGQRQDGNEDPAQVLHRRGDIRGQQGWQGGGHHHAAQREHLARGGDAYPLLRRFADLGAPGVVVDGGQAEADEGQRQGQHQPGEATRRRRRAAPAAPRGRGRAAAGRMQDQPPPVAEAIAPLSQQRIDQRIGEARQQQHGADQRQRQADAVGIQLGNMHVERQRGEGQRKAERAVGQHLPRRHRAGGHHPAPSRLARSPGSRVRGSSQMAKKARAKSTSSMRPVSLPWW